MTDTTPTKPDAEEVAAFVRENLTEALSALGQASHFVSRDDAAGQAAIAQGYASLAIAAQLGRIADWLDGVQLTDPAQLLLEDVGDVEPCVFCGNEPARGTSLEAVDPHEEHPSCGARACGLEFRAFGDTKPRAVR